MLFDIIIILFCIFQDEYIVDAMEPEMTPEEFGKVVEPVLLEYFEHGDTGEVEVGIDISIEWSLTPT